MPRPGDAVQVDEREPAPAHDLEVVARDGLPPPRLLHAPPVAHLDRLAPPVPGERDEASGLVQLRVDRRVFAQQAGHGRSSPVMTAPPRSRPRRPPAAIATAARRGVPRGGRAGPPPPGPAPPPPRPARPPPGHPPPRRRGGGAPGPTPPPPPHPVPAERDRQPGELPCEPGVPCGLGNEQRQLLARR